MMLLKQFQAPYKLKPLEFISSYNKRRYLMKLYNQKISHQKGAANLFVAVILLIGITLVAISATKTVLTETKIAANNYRTVQATAAAQAAMDRAVAYFMAGGLDQDGDATVDYELATPFTFTLPETPVAGAQLTSAQFYFDNADDNQCDCQLVVAKDSDSDGDGDCMGGFNAALIIAQGRSDDNSAVRTISQCVGSVDIFNNGESPQQPFVSKAGVGVFGNAKIINRYSNISIWAGGADTVHGASYGTYLRPSGTETGDYTEEELDSSCEVSPCNVANNPGPNTQPVSNQKSGNGIDVITDDLTLASKSTSTTNYTDRAENEFFDMFFEKTKADTKELAANSDRVFAAGESIDGETGLIWVDGNIHLNGTTVVGSPNKFAILIIDGNLDKLNGATIYGIVYVTGTVEIAGNPVVKGSLIAENPAASTGAGTLTLVFKPWGASDGSPNPFINGTGAIIPGSWKDW
ncbi:MAG: hypothetical protein K9L22_09970 [Methylococcaceae bacterium]|nr:hypothetical protein [Methylococcaceae bacterium]